MRCAILKNRQTEEDIGLQRTGLSPVLVVFVGFPPKKCLSFGGGGGLQFPMARAQTETTAKFEDCDILTFFDERAAWRLSEIVCCLFIFWFVWGFFLSTHTHPRPPAARGYCFTPRDSNVEGQVWAAGAWRK